MNSYYSYIIHGSSNNRVIYLQYVLKTSLNPTTNKKYLVNVDKLLKEILKVVFIYQTNSIYILLTLYTYQNIYNNYVYIYYVLYHIYIHSSVLETVQMQT